MSKYLLGLDSGTTGCKACIFDLEGHMVAYDYEEYSIITFPDKPGYIEQDGEVMTKHLFKCVKAAIEKSGVANTDIVALGLSTQGGCVGYCDEDGNTIGNWICWQDMRGFEVTDVLEKKMPTLSYMKETNNFQIGYSGQSKHVWMMENKPEVVKKAVHVATMQEYFLRKFGAKDWYSDAASISRESNANLDEHYYSKKVFKAYGMDIEKRGKLAYNGQIVAEVSPELAEKTGLAVGCKICVGGLDQCCSPFGCGMVKDGDSVMTIGTFGTCYVCSDKLYHIPGDTMTWKSHLYFENGPKNYTAETVSFASASAYRWLRDTICTKEMFESLDSGKDVYEILNDLIASSAPGAHGVTFLPYLQGRSCCTVDDFATAQFNGLYSFGTFTGMRMSTTRADMVRAVAEGVLYELRDMKETLEEDGMNVHDLVVNGGVTKSPLWCQMMADIWHTSVTVLETSESGCLGAAMFAGIGVGMYESPYEAVDKCVRVKKVYMPSDEHKDVYDAGFERFKRTYTALENAYCVKTKGPLIQRIVLWFVVKLRGNSIRRKIKAGTYKG